MPLADVGAWLAHFVATKLYPALVFAVFLGVIAMLATTVILGNDFQGYMRRLTGSLLPFVALVIMVAMGNTTMRSVAEGLGRSHFAFQFGLGLAVGGAFMESTHHFLDADGAAGTFAFFVASLGAFVLWAVMGGALASLNLALLGLVLGSGLHVVFRGIP